MKLLLNYSESVHTPSYTTTEDGLDPFQEQTIRQAKKSPGLNRSDLERQIIISQKVCQEEEDDLAMLAMVNTVFYSDSVFLPVHGFLCSFFLLGKRNLFSCKQLTFIVILLVIYNLCTCTNYCEILASFQ